MSFDVAWYDQEQTIILVTVNKGSTWNDYHVAVDQIIQLAMSLDHRIDLIFWDDVGMPVGNPLPEIKIGGTKILRQKNLHMSVMAGSRGSTSFSRIVFEALLKVFKINTSIVRFAKSVDDAVDLIYTNRVKTEPSPPA